MDPLSIIWFVVLILLSAFFSGSELGLMSIPMHKIDSFIKQRKSGAKQLKKIRSNPDRLLITILLGNNLVNVTVASLAAKVSIDISRSMGSNESLAIGISTGIITIILLLFGEIFPKSLANNYSEYIALKVSKFYLVLGKILFPLVISVEFFMNLFNKKKEIKCSITDEEVESFIEMGHKEGILEKGEYEKIKNILYFHDTTAQEIMIPRVKIDAIENTLTVNQAIDKIIYYSHSRIPVFAGNIDNIEYFVRIEELILAKNKGLGRKKLSTLKLTPIIKVPLTKPIHKILEEFKKSRNHISIVMDEYGGVAGILTLEDVIEEVFGEIHDETDTEKLAIKKNGKGLIVESYIMFEELLDHLNIEFFHIGLSQEEFGGETLSYFVTSHLGRFPENGEEIIINLVHMDDDKSHYKSLKLKIISIHKNTIGTIKAELI